MCIQVLYYFSCSVHAGGGLWPCILLHQYEAAVHVLELSEVYHLGHDNIVDSNYCFVFELVICDYIHCISAYLRPACVQCKTIKNRYSNTIILGAIPKPIQDLNLRIIERLAINAYSPHGMRQRHHAIHKSCSPCNLNLVPNLTVLYFFLIVKEAENRIILLEICPELELNNYKCCILFKLQL